MIGLTSLWDIMKPFNPSKFLEIASLLGSLSASDKALRLFPNVEIGGGLLSDDYKRKYAMYFQALQGDCVHLNLPMSAKAASRLAEKASEPRVTHADLVQLSDDLERRLVDEMQSMVFFSIKPDKQHLLSDANLFGDSVAEAFPSAAYDITHAGRCLALDQWTASVFHSMRVLEVGLQVLV
jgi:hypothetical protein